MKVVSAAQMREIDRVAIDERLVPSLALMERAGQAVADEIAWRFEPEAVVIVTGKGNNAGDGFVVARLLAERDVQVRCAMLAAPESLAGDAAANYARLPDSVEVRPVAAYEELVESLSDMELIVDAILGTGVTGAVRGLFGEAITALNEAEAPVVAVDIPTGLPTDGGPLSGPCVCAEVTITIGLPKIGQVVYPGCDYVGQLIVADIGFPSDLLNDEGLKLNIIDKEIARSALPERQRESHKGTYGSCLIVAGSRGMTGAAILAAGSALRSGAGMVFAALPAGLNDIFEANVIEALSLPLASASGDFLDDDSRDPILREAERMNAVAVGPGLGQQPETQQLVRHLLPALNLPLVIDADGLNALVGHAGLLKQRSTPTIVTPHPGEMARLLGAETKAIQADRLGVAGEFAARYQVHVILKGAQTIIAAPDGQLFINPTGNSALAKGGSGDVLTGLLVGLLAQGASPLAACQLGVFLHGLAGDLAGRRYGVRAALPGDVVDRLGDAFLKIEYPENKD